MDNLSMNIKSALLAAAILLFTYFYYSGKGGSFLSLGSAIVFWLLCGAALVLCTLMVRLVAHMAISGLIYPNAVSMVLLPFLCILLLFWLAYGTFSIPAFADFPGYSAILKGFFQSHLLYIAVVSVIIGGGLYFSLPKDIPATRPLFNANLLFALSMAGAFVLSVAGFYWAKKISQPALDPKYAAYKSLGEDVQYQGLEISLLLDAGPDHTASQPYYLEERGELIISLHYASSNKNAPLFKVFKIDRQGKIADSLDTEELTVGSGSLIFDKGLIRPANSKNAYFWVFDGTKTLVQESRQDSKNKIAELQKDMAAIRLEHFHKTARLECGTGSQIQWNGTGYFQIFHHGDTARFRIDNLYAQNADGGCGARPVDYYPAKGLDFALLRLDEKTYYIIKPKKK
ncbi:hypothetical protein HDC92_002028 [Pedobacter sp. AK017]|uniref:hypothetical protein n=1 Tax=Pedobacter sp. AK017 TaxID=2723073 RepID=UPI00161DED02|nr:hypothetical protein [Pedobacter sp. AK017]MBB5438352.1 hypothetical protein [Pedobacter sp. AK017]